MVFYDFESFRYDWLVVLIEMGQEKEEETVIVNDRDAMVSYFKDHENDIWVGFNSRHYDQYLLKGIVSGICDIPEKVHKLNDWIIVEKREPWQYSPLLRDVKVNNFDVMPNPPVGLKTLEGFMGSDIRETSVPFDIDRKLTEEEIQQTIYYCRHDVEETINVFLERYAEFEAQFGIVSAFNLDLACVGDTEARITAKVLGCKKIPVGTWQVYSMDGYRGAGYKTVAVSEAQAINNVRHNLEGDYECGANNRYYAEPVGIPDDEFDYFFLPCIKIQKYRNVLTWFKDRQREAPRNRHSKNFEIARKAWYSQELTMDVAGIPHKFGFGGLHGAIDHPVHLDGYILHVDVGSYYPSMLIAHGLVTRAANNDNYKKVYDTRMELKRAGKKREQAPYKKLLNALSGAMKDKTNPAYDPRNNNIMCINGQLMLLDLIEHLEVVKGFELIQSNTDGLIIRIPDTDEAFEQVDDICWEWESRCSTDQCKILLGLDTIREIYQKDVNNYLWVDIDGGVERKGAYVKELSAIDYDLPILNKALVEYMVHKTPVEETINGCDDLIEFQKIVKLSDAYEYVELEHGASHWEQKYDRKGRKCGKKLVYEHRERYVNKSYRVFASKSPEAGRLLKCRTRADGSFENSKFGNTPDKCFVYNESVVGVKCPPELDKQWYIDFAEKRLRDFGL